MGGLPTLLCRRDRDRLLGSARRSTTTVAADDFVASRRAALEHLETLHLSANHLVSIEGDRATCASAAVIHRVRPEDAERFDTCCAYPHSLVRTATGWKISKVGQTVYSNTGNPDVHQGARRR